MLEAAQSHSPPTSPERGPAPAVGMVAWEPETPVPILPVALTRRHSPSLGLSFFL